MSVEYVRWWRARDAMIWSGIILTIVDERQTRAGAAPRCKRGRHRNGHTIPIRSHPILTTSERQIRYLDSDRLGMEICKIDALREDKVDMRSRRQESRPCTPD